MTLQLAFSTLACPDWSLERAIEEALRWGYDGLELGLIDGQTIEPNLSAGERERIGQLLRESGARLAAVDSSISLVSDLLEVEIDTQLRELLDVAAAWGAPLVRVFGGEPPGGLTESDGVARATRILQRMSLEAERRGVRIGLETHDAFSAASVVAQVLGGVGSPQVGAVWDVLHTHRMGESPAQVWDFVGPRVMAVHIKDARRAPENDGWKPALLGDGEIPVRECVSVLQRAGYQGWLVAEWEKAWYPEIEEPTVALPHEIEMLKAWIAEDEGAT